MAMTPDSLADRALGPLLELPGPRSLVAMAGPPGAGKSTVAKLVVDRLNHLGRRAALVPMDGFHLDNGVLRARGLLARKGAPDTFDVGGFCHLVSRVADGEPDIAYPLFDRRRDLAVAGAAILPPDLEFILFEGNYLLLRDQPWARLARFWSYSIWIDASLEQLQRRLMDRWYAEGLSEDEARARVEGNDLPNISFVRPRSAPGELVLSPHGG